MSRFDVIVLGAGPGGYVAALRAAQLDLRVACVDERARPGGTCLNVGCIPSKALLDASARFAGARDALARYGVVVDAPGLDLEAMMARKDEAVEALTHGVSGLFEKHGIEHVAGRGRLGAAGEVVVRDEEGEERTLHGEHVILAPGSVPVALPDVDVDEERILSSRGALALGEVPEELVVVGAGYIGLELGSVWSRLGARTACIELTGGVLPGMDGELAERLQPILEAQGLEFQLGRKVVSAQAGEDGVDLAVAPADGDDGDAEERRATHLLVAVGRAPATGELGLEEAGVETDGNGFVRVDARFRTTAEGVFAVGDAIGEPMLAHKAQDEALACVEALAGRGPGYVHYASIPAVVYTEPEVASVGATEEALEEEGVAYRVGRASFAHNPRAHCTGETEGFVKVLAAEEDDRLLGAHLIGPQAGTVVHEIVTAMKLGGTAEELGRTCHGHPTFNEAVREAALAVHGRPIHG
ncbi:MAG: dihydrolipoyl dehydrogenase [Myxococcota bacterium]|nr:dihydrolipoyl dehydrogenase [Myxococcota bacterium]